MITIKSSPWEIAVRWENSRTKIVDVHYFLTEEIITSSYVEFLCNIKRSRDRMKVMRCTRSMCRTCDLVGVRCKGNSSPHGLQNEGTTSRRRRGQKWCSRYKREIKVSLVERGRDDGSVDRGRRRRVGRRGWRQCPICLTHGPITVRHSRHSRASEERGSRFQTVKKNLLNTREGGFLRAVFSLAGYPFENVATTVEPTDRVREEGRKGWEEEGSMNLGGGSPPSLSLVLVTIPTSC